MTRDLDPKSFASINYLYRFNYLYFYSIINGGNSQNANAANIANKIHKLTHSFVDSHHRFAIFAALAY